MIAWNMQAAAYIIRLCFSIPECTNRQWNRVTALKTTQNATNYHGYTTVWIYTSPQMIDYLFPSISFCHHSPYNNSGILHWTFLLQFNHVWLKKTFYQKICNFDLHSYYVPRVSELPENAIYWKCQDKIIQLSVKILWNPNSSKVHW